MSIATALARVRAKAHTHLSRRAEELSGITKELHRTAPRGGLNLNRYGEKRSAPGEPPAMETGRLFANIDQGVAFEAPLEVTVIVNTKVLELGTRRVKPRPLGRKALAEFKARVR